MEAAHAAEGRLTPTLCLTICTDQQVQANLAAVLVEIRGRQLAIVQAVTNSHFLLTGPIAEVNGAYERAPTNRSVGSTNKAWLVAKLVAEGYQTLCNRVPVGFRDEHEAVDAGDQSCADGRGVVSLREATARSLNFAFADAVRKIGIPNTKEYFRNLGFDFDPQLKGRQWVDGLVLGYRVTAAPIVLMRNLAAFYRGYRGETPLSCLPSLTVTAEAAGCFDWRDIGVTTAVLQHAGSVLSAPIESD